MFEAFLKTHDLRSMLKGQWMPCPPKRDRDAWTGLPRETKEALVCWGDEAKDGYPMLTATQFLAFTRTGDRQVFERPYFERRNKLLGAALAECVLADGAHLDAVIDGLWCIMEETSWVISAHNGSDHPGAVRGVLPDEDNPYVDLFAAQTAATLADILYLLEDELCAVSPLICRRVRTQIEKRVLRPFMNRDDFWWMGIIRKDVNNWTPWIVSNVFEAALLLERDKTHLCEIVARGLRMLDRYLAVLPPDGGCDEGVGYFNMAGASLFDCLEQLFAVTHGQADFYNEPLIRKIGAYPPRMWVKDDQFLNFADCDARPMLDGDRLYLYGVRTDNARLRALGAALCAKRAQKADGFRPRDVPQTNRVLSALFTKVKPCPPVTPPPFEAMDGLQVYIWRWEGITLAFKGGHNGESHNHNDVGSVLAYVDGRPCLVDMGNCVYTSRTFGPARYTLDNTRSRNHNLPLIGGEEQAPGREYAAREVRADALGAGMELSGAYPRTAHLRRYTRTLTLAQHGFELFDEMTLDQPQPVTWVFMLRNRPVCTPGTAEPGDLRLRFSQTLASACEPYPVTDERMARNFPGTLWRLTLTAAPDTHHAQRICFERA